MTLASLVLVPKAARKECLCLVSLRNLRIANYLKQLVLQTFLAPGYEQLSSGTVRSLYISPLARPSTFFFFFFSPRWFQRKLKAWAAENMNLLSFPQSTRACTRDNYGVRYSSHSLEEIIMWTIPSPKQNQSWRSSLVENPLSPTYVPKGG